MVEYAITTEKIPFTGKKKDPFKSFLESMGLTLKRIETAGVEKLIYVVEREKPLKDEEGHQIVRREEVFQVKRI